MTINFIRHSYTAGNLRKAYIGSMDEPLCKEGIELLGTISYPGCTVLAASPMKRCMETAALIYGSRFIAEVPGFKECDFGIFEGKNYIDLKGNAEYLSWVEGGCTAACPGGEDPFIFRLRCIEAFESFIRGLRESDVLSLVVHGGTIMSIMEKYAVPHKGFYDWYVKNGCGYICTYKNGILEVTGYIG